MTIVFATAPGGVATVYGQGAAYATAREVGTATTNNHFAGQATGYNCYEGVIVFATSGIPDTDDVSDVVLSLDGSIDGSTTDFTVNAASSAYDGGAALTTDYVAGSLLSALSQYATFATSGYSADYNAFTSLGAAFNSAINKTGNTAIMIYSDRHSAGTTPTGEEYVGFTDADAAGTTVDPKLDITHAAGGGGPTVKTLAVLGVG